jgi:hypothetical protein
MRKVATTARVRLSLYVGRLCVRFCYDALSRCAMSLCGHSYAYDFKNVCLGEVRTSFVFTAYAFKLLYQQCGFVTLNHLTFLRTGV